MGALGDTNPAAAAAAAGQLIQESSLHSSLLPGCVTVKQEVTQAGGRSDRAAAALKLPTQTGMGAFCTAAAAAAAACRPVGQRIVEADEAADALLMLSR
jgi:hypothetical protein